MASTTEMSIKPTNLDGRPNRQPVKRVMQALEDVLRGDTKAFDPIMEQLKQCPEAFKVGEILGKAFDSVKYGQDEVFAGRFLPPSGTIIPPIV
jgi:hypothetical protein